MRNSKVKTLKKTALFTLSLLLITAGTAFADTAWDNFKNSKTTSPTNMTLSGTATADSTLELDTPPVPKFNIVGSGNATIDASGYTTKAVIEAANGADVTLSNISIKNGSNVGGTDLSSGGGAIHNAGSILNINGTITKTSGKVTETSTSASTFSGNKGVNGGAIFANGDSKVTVDGVLFDGNEATKTGAGSSIGYGGAIFSSSTGTGTTLTIKDSVFKGNKANIFDPSTGNPSGGLGGAVANYNGSAVVSNSLFTGNFAHTEGGAIYNRADMVITNSDFVKNNTKGSGGAVSNGVNSDDRNAIMTISGSNFENNYSTSSGGAIFNQSSATGFTHVLKINNGTTFKNNFNAVDSGALGSSSTGGAIFNKGGSTSNNTQDAILYVNFDPNASFDTTAAELDITNGTLHNASSDTVNFISNIALKGGAIVNKGIAVINNASFDSNGQMDSTNTFYTGILNAGQRTNHGGAIYNEPEAGASAKMVVNNSSFTNNVAATDGGAVYNSGKMTIIDSDFANNKAGSGAAAGGAVYTVATNAVTEGAYTKIIAQNRDVNIGVRPDLPNGINGSVADLTDSLAFRGSNDHVVTGDFLAANGRTLNINSDVVGLGVHSATGKSLVNINVGDTSNNYNGKVSFNDDASITGANIYLKSGTLAFAHDRSLDATNVLHMSGGTLDLLNQEYGNHQFRPKEFYLDANSNIKVDVDLYNERMDGIFVADGTNVTVAPGATLTVDEMYALTDANGSSALVPFTDSPDLMNNTVLQGEGSKIVQAPVNKYAVTKYELINDPSGREDGVYFGFTKLGPSDPAISGSVAAQAAYIMMDNIYRQSFANMDMVALMTPEEREALKALQCGNKIDMKRARGYHTGVFAPNLVPEERDGIYVRPFANFENVPLKNGPRVSNVFYGSLIGGESDIIDLGHGWDGNFSLFGAYHGSHQAYNGVDIWQNGGTFGAVGTVYKGRFFSGLTANVGASAAEARHGFGNDQFPILMTGAAWKSGYNLGMFSNKFILQPSYMMSYTFVNVFDYNSASGARITQDPLNAIEIIPGLKLIGNFKNGWQPYLGVNMTWNIMDRTKFYANDVMLPQLSVKPFVEYGLGMQKRYGDRFTGYGQAMFRSGGRNGVALTLGLRWALGN